MVFLKPLNGKLVHARKPTNLNELYQFRQEEWSHIQPELRKKLADGCKKCVWFEVRLAKGHLIKYLWVQHLIDLDCIFQVL